MSNQIMNVAKGIVCGLVVGAATGYIVRSSKKEESAVKKTTSKAIKAVSNFIDEMK